MKGRPRRRRDEEGAIAIVFAICSVLLFGFAAIAVDLGDAYARKRDIQTQADLAALAAGAQLPDHAGTRPQIMQALQQYAAGNRTLGQDTTTWNFVDADPANGFVEFDGDDVVRVTAPAADVDFGFAGVLGVTGTRVAAEAAAEVRTPATALPFFVPAMCSWGDVTVVGDPPPGHDSSDGPCAGANDGNFGALWFPRDDESSVTTTAARNILEGIQHTLAAFEGYAGPLDACAGEYGAVTVSNPPAEDGPGVNCLETDTGNVMQAATDGFIRGVGGDRGRLNAIEHPTAPGCDPTGSGQSNALVLGTLINNEVLTCYFTNDTSTLADVGQPTLDPADVHMISPAIFDSPRFFWLPVIEDPSSGGSGSFAILGFRGAFLTGQPGNATRVDPHTSETVAAGNGLQIGSSKVQGLSVALINPDALPETAAPTGDTIPYLGTGTKVVRLVE